jgi:hypothetical protein
MSLDVRMTLSLMGCLATLVGVILGMLIGGQPEVVKSRVHSTPSVCKELGGVFEGDESSTMCILDSCSVPP